MKLNAYTDKVDLNTIGNARYNVNHYDGLMQQTLQQKTPNLTGAVVDALNMYVKHEEDKFNEANNMALMNAKTDYQRRVNELMYNKETGFMYTKEGGAANISQAFQEASRRAANEVRASLPQYEHVVGEFDDYAYKLDTQNYATINKHEQTEYQTYKKTSYDSATQTLTDTLLHTKDENGMAEVFKSAQINAIQCWGNYGEDKVKEIIRDDVTKMAKAGFEQAMADDNYELASKIVSTAYKFGLKDSDALSMKVKINDKFDIENTEKLASEALNKYPNDPVKQLEYIKQATLNLYGETKGVTLTDLDKALATQAGLDYELGGDPKEGKSDCARSMKSVLTHMDIEVPANTADEFYLYCQKNNSLVDPKDVKDGDLVFWHVPNSRWETTTDPNAIDADHAYMGVTHIGMYRDGKVWQMGSNGWQPIDMDTYKIVGVGRVIKERNPVIDERKAAKRNELAVKALNTQRARRNNAIKEKDTHVVEAMKAIENERIQWNYEHPNQKKSITETINQVKPMVTNDLKGLQSDNLLTGLMQSHLDEQNGSGWKGREGDLQQCLEAFKQAIWLGLPKEDLIEQIDAVQPPLGFAARSKILAWADQRQAGEGYFAVDIKGALNRAVANGYIDSKGKDEHLSTITELIAQKVTDYRSKNQRNPNESELDDMMKKSIGDVVTNRETPRVNSYWVFNFKERSDYSKFTELDLARCSIKIKPITTDKGEHKVEIYQYGVLSDTVNAKGLDGVLESKYGVTRTTLKGKR